MEEHLLKDITNKHNDPRIPIYIKSYGNSEKDPYLNANFFSKLIFYWSCRLISLAKKTSLKRNYLGKLEGHHKADSYMNLVYNIWKEKGYRFAKSLKLLKTTLQSNLCILNTYNRWSYTYYIRKLPCTWSRDI
jgi:hypothetical protein